MVEREAVDVGGGGRIAEQNDARHVTPIMPRFRIVTYEKAEILRDEIVQSHDEDIRLVITRLQREIQVRAVLFMRRLRKGRGRRS